MASSIFKCCHGCMKDRNYGLCHSTCEEYLGAVAKNEERKRKEKLDKQVPHTIKRSDFVGTAKARHKDRRGYFKGDKAKGQL